MSLFARLLLLLVLLPAVSLAVVFGLLWRNAARLERNLEAENLSAGRRASLEGTRLLETGLKSTQARIVGEKARKLEAFFSDIARATQLEAALCRQFLADPGDPRDAPPLYTADEVIDLRRDDPAFRDGTWKRRPYAMYHVAPGVPGDAVAEPMRRLRRLGGFFAYTQNTLPSCDSVYFGDARGFILGYPGGVDPFKPEYDPRQRPWYRQVVKRGRLTWDMSLDKNGRDLFITFAEPVRSARGDLLGVAAVDVRLTPVIAEVFTVGDLKVSRAVLLDEQDQVRVIARYDEGAAGGTGGNGAPAAFDAKTMLDMPHVSRLDEAGFAHVAEQVRAAEKGAKGPGARDPGAAVFWEGRGIADSASVFVCAPIRFRPAPAAPAAATTSAGTTNPSGGVGGVGGDDAERWHYIVQLPLAPLAEPVRAVTGEIDASTRDMAGAIRAENREAAFALAAIVAGTLAAALLVAWVAARRASRPLVEMAGVAREVGRGNLERQAAERSGGEIGDLEKALNAMIRGLRQRDLLRQTFGRYVAPGVVDQVLSRGDATLGGVKRKVTIFFSDLKGFTTLSERTDPDVLVNLLNEYFDAMTRVVLEAEGTLDKYIGDAILAFWGDPVPHADDAARACRAALEQTRRLKALWPSWDARGLPRLDMRIGIETGEAIVGNVGSELKLNYTVLGDAVNFASRLEAVNKLYGTRILIGENARREAGDAIEVRELDLLTVAGKTRPVRVYELLGMAGEVGAEVGAGFKAYERALSAWRGRRWDEAEVEVKQAEALLGADEPTRALLARVAACRLDPPPAGWDGSVTLDHK